jgi:hypothetical protein
LKISTLIFLCQEYFLGLLDSSLSKKELDLIVRWNFHKLKDFWQYYVLSTRVMMNIKINIISSVVYTCALVFELFIQLSFFFQEVSIDAVVYCHWWLVYYDYIHFLHNHCYNHFVLIKSEYCLLPDSTLIIKISCLCVRGKNQTFSFWESHDRDV